MRRVILWLAMAMSGCGEADVTIPSDPAPLPTQGPQQVEGEPAVLRPLE